MITTINCPNCKTNINVDSWFTGFSKSDNGLYYFTCKGCKTRIGSTLSYHGVLAIWTKEKEIK